MLSDYHVHTSFSDDSVYPMEHAIINAIRLGIDEICFTEHIDYGVKTTLNCDCDAYWKELERCEAIFKDRIVIKRGMEFGVQTHTIPEFQRTFLKYPFDFIILSCHQVGNQEFWNYKFQEGRTQEEYNLRYYEEILKVIQQYDDYSVLGHLDMIRRYDPKGAYPFDRVRDIVAEILQTAIRKGKGIEVNTSCFRYQIPDLTPSREILQLYRDLGGSILTVGSDSHSEEWMGYHISNTKRILKEMKFEKIYTFDKMTPIEWKL